MGADAPIMRLSSDLISKIAAGEVVENPASAIKEMVENSLDAGATSVTVEIRDGGIPYFRVSDNGRGIRSQDIRMAFERHATSKISSLEDLYDLRTLGFRGEALASVAAVSRVTLTTHHAGEQTGVRVINEGGVLGRIEETAAPRGTTIVVRDLFFNTPVRLRFLKKPVTEAAKVSDVMGKMILSHPDISFRLISGGKQVYSSSGSGDLRNAVFCLYGRESAEQMIPVHAEGSISVDGLVGVGSEARSNRSRQHFFINGRSIRSPLLSQALEEGCRERVTIGHYPVCVLNLRMPGSLVDVNVHPNKLEVRFSDERLVFEKIRDAVAASFSNSRLKGAPSLYGEEDADEPPVVRASVQIIPTQGVPVRIPDLGARPIPDPTPARTGGAPQAGPAPFAAGQRSVSGNSPSPDPRSESELPADSPPDSAAAPSQVSAQKAPSDPGFSPDGASVPNPESVSSLSTEPLPQESSPEEEPHKYMRSSPEAGEAQPEEDGALEKRQAFNRMLVSVFSGSPAPQQAQQMHMDLHAHEKEGAPEDDLRGYRMVGVAFDTYIILENQEQLLLIDQHAAHERILYEKLMKQIDTGRASQVLLVPMVVHVTPQEAALIERFLPDIRQAGYGIEPFGDDTYQIREVPNVLGEPESRKAFLEMVDHLGELRLLSTWQKRRDAILQMACKMAVKGGDRLSRSEIAVLLDEMMKTDSPPTCPHGRPLVVILRRRELEKRFKRINE